MCLFVIFSGLMFVWSLCAACLWCCVVLFVLFLDVRYLVQGLVGGFCLGRGMLLLV